MNPASYPPPGGSTLSGKMLAIRNTTLFRLLLQVVQVPTFYRMLHNTGSLTHTPLLSESFSFLSANIHTYVQTDCQIVSEGRKATW